MSQEVSAADQDTLEYLECLAEDKARLVEAPWSSWDSPEPPAIRAWLESDLSPVPPEFLKRTDGAALLYKGKVTSVHGAPEGCKGWFACAAVAEVLAAGGTAAYIDFEDSIEGILRRLLQLGVEKKVIIERFGYVGPKEPLTDNTRLNLRRTMELHLGSPDLVVIDSVIQAVSMQGLNTNDNDDIGTWFRLLPWFITEKYGSAVLLIDHSPKDSPGARGALGGQTKLGAVDCSFSVEVKQPFAPGREGLVVVKVGKDRAGLVRAKADGKPHLQQVVAYMSLNSDPDSEQVTIRLDPPDQIPFASLVKGLAREQDDLMQGIGEVISAATAGLNKRGVREAVKATGGGASNSRVDTALEALVETGYVEVTDGPNRSKIHRWVCPITPAEARASGWCPVS